MSLKNVLDTALKVINFIKPWPLNAHHFSILCEKLGHTDKTLLLHGDVQWLSRGEAVV